MDHSQIKNAARELHDFTLESRRWLHANPELSFGEHRTAEYISEKLTGLDIEHRPIANTGVLAKIEGRGDLKRCVVLRADIDALPIDEAPGCGFESQNPGVMHACGHDIHAAVLLGVMALLNDIKDRFEGTVFGLFQPGEELAPGGASIVMKEDPFRDYDVAAFIGEHVSPELPVGVVGFREGIYMASADEIRMTVHGKGGHAALPHRLKDPVVASAETITALQNIVSRNAASTIPTVLSIGKVIANGATNIIPSEVYMEGTLRTMNERWRAEAQRLIREIAAGVASAHGVATDVDIPESGYPCVVNDPAVTRAARKVARKMWGEENVAELDLRMTAEDFGTYTLHYPSLFYRLGTVHRDGTPVGELHTPEYRPSEEALDVGVATMAAIALEFLKQ